MSFDIDRLFQHAFVISIDRNRLDRFYRALDAVFGQWEHYVRPKHVNGCTDRGIGPNRRITKANVMVIERAKAEGLPFALIFEDDAFPRPDALEHIKKCLDAAPEDCQVLKLGSNATSEVDAFNDVLSIVRDSRGSHAYIVLASAYDKFIARHGVGPFIPVDMYFGRVVPTYVVNSDIFVQYCDRASANGSVGYSHGSNLSSPQPPDGFLPVDELLALSGQGGVPQDRHEESNQ